MNRTGSIGSRVAPAVMRTVFPLKSILGFNMSSILSKISSGSASLPLPLSPQANLPLCASTNRQPRFCKVSRFFTVAGAKYIFVFIAGAIKTGQAAASSVVVKKSSAIPQAYFAITFAVHGAITNKSAFFANETCSTSQVKFLLNISQTTRFLDSVSKVNGVTKRAAFSVITT